MEENARGTQNAGVLTGGAGEVKNVGVLDLTGMRSAEELARITSIKNTGVILVPASLTHALGAIPTQNVGTTIAVPEGEHVKVLTGQITMAGEALAGGGRGDILVTVGQLIFTSQVRESGYKQLIAIGEVAAPVGSEAAIGAALGQITGRVTYYPCEAGASVRTAARGDITAAVLANRGGEPNDTLLIIGDSTITGPIEAVGFKHIACVGGLLTPKASEGMLSEYLWSSGGVLYYSGTPRRFQGKDSFSSDFFDLLDGPVTLVLQGSFVFEPDVSREVLRSKVSEIVLMGRIKAPRQLVPLLQVLTVDRKGVISALEDDEAAKPDTPDVPPGSMQPPAPPPPLASV